MLDVRRLEIARNSLLLTSLPDRVIGPLLASSTARSYQRGETLFLHGDAAHSVHIVIEGWVKLYRIAPNGSETVVALFSKGESFGEAVAIRNGTYPVSAEAVIACEVIEIPTSVLQDMMRGDVEIAESILASAFAHLHSLVSQLEQLTAQTGPQRVARFLLEFCEQSYGSAIVTLPYDKVLIAGRLGMKPESLSRAFARLRSVGVTIKGNSAAIDDVEALQDFSEQDPARSWKETR